MAEHLSITRVDKRGRYAELLPQIEGLCHNAPTLISALANVSSALRMCFGFFWVGFYLVEGEELILGPFQGDIACTRIAKGRGVCGSAWDKAETIIVPDVDAFPGHIACSSESKSEIVIPIKNKDNEIIGVLDVDSNQYEDFDTIDAEYLGYIAKLIGELNIKMI